MEWGFGRKATTRHLEGRWRAGAAARHCDLGCHCSEERGLRMTCHPWYGSFWPAWLTPLVEVGGGVPPPWISHHGHHVQEEHDALTDGFGLVMCMFMYVCCMGSNGFQCDTVWDMMRFQLVPIWMYVMYDMCTYVRNVFLYVLMFTLTSYLVGPRRFHLCHMYVYAHVYVCLCYSWHSEAPRPRPSGDLAACHDSASSLGIVRVLEAAPSCSRS